MRGTLPYGICFLFVCLVCKINLSLPLFSKLQVKATKYHLFPALGKLQKKLPAAGKRIPPCVYNHTMLHVNQRLRDQYTK